MDKAGQGNFKKVMETISGIIEPCSGEDQKLGHHALRPVDSGVVFILSSQDVNLDIFLRRFVIAIGYRTNTCTENGRTGFIVVSLMPGETHGENARRGETAQGLLRPLENISSPYGTHGLHDTDDKLVHILKSDLVKLDDYVGQWVIAEGNPLAGAPAGEEPPHWSVTEIYIFLPTLPGNKFNISLKTKNSAAFSWALSAISDRPVVELIGERHDPDDATVEGGPVTSLFSFWTRSCGTTTLTFRKTRFTDMLDVRSELRYLVFSE